MVNIWILETTSLVGKDSNIVLKKVNLITFGSDQIKEIPIGDRQQFSEGGSLFLLPPSIDYATLQFVGKTSSF